MHHEHQFRFTCGMVAYLGYTLYSIKYSIVCTYVEGFSLPLSHLVLVECEAGGNPTEPHVPQHVFVICHGPVAGGGTYTVSGSYNLNKTNSTGFPVPHYL